MFPMLPTSGLYPSLYWLLLNPIIMPLAEVRVLHQWMLSVACVSTVVVVLVC